MLVLSLYGIHSDSLLRTCKYCPGPVETGRRRCGGGQIQSSAGVGMSKKAGRSIFPYSLLSTSKAIDT